ncbi:hypothetical protein AAG570_002614 [Ranatra chinensis]|uniref:methenyltetrahydrofolate cyclohydrolase n=1 Tax=Ranatra chinensis TaxID=642074 RepID=A0ABD0YKC2_9HEMI
MRTALWFIPILVVFWWLVNDHCFINLFLHFQLYKVIAHCPPCRYISQVIDGKKLAEDVLSQLKTDIEKYVAQTKLTPKLTAVLVGKNAASESYVKIKMKAAKKVGIATETVRCPESVSEDDLLKIIHELNANPKVNGILVQLPVPNHLPERVVCNAVAPEKDVDGFNITNIGRLCLNLKTMVPCTALAVYHIIRHIGVQTLGKSAVVCGRSKNVGMPIALMLHSQGGAKGGGLDATTTICHRFTPQNELAKLTKSADIIVSAAGVPKLIRGDMIKEGAIVIDVGMTRLLDETTNKASFVGDVDFDEVVKIAGYVTPVPGGVGPVTVAMLLKNTFRAAFIQQNPLYINMI